MWSAGCEAARRNHWSIKEQAEALSCTACWVSIRPRQGTSSPGLTGPGCDNCTPTRHGSAAARTPPTQAGAVEVTTRPERTNTPSWPTSSTPTRYCVILTGGPAMTRSAEPPVHTSNQRSRRTPQPLARHPRRHRSRSAFACAGPRQLGCYSKWGRFGSSYWRPGPDAGAANHRPGQTRRRSSIC
jgi:hypothetical protein